MVPPEQQFDSFGEGPSRRIFTCQDSIIIRIVRRNYSLSDRHGAHLLVLSPKAGCQDIIITVQIWSRDGLRLEL